MSPWMLDPRLANCRRLFLHQHEVPVHIGVHAFEQGAPQRIVINVDLFVPLETSSSSCDNIADVVDYDFVRQTVAARVAQGHIQLQETLADDLLRAMLAHPGVLAARVSTEKPDVYPDCKAVGVEVFGLKPQATHSATVEPK